MLREVRGRQLSVYGRSSGADRERLDRNIAATEMEITDLSTTLSELAPAEVQFMLRTDAALRNMLIARDFHAPWTEFN